jgi:hypothetical protein
MDRTIFAAVLELSEPSTSEYIDLFIPSGILPCTDPALPVFCFPGLLHFVIV